jgi:DNA replication protein DnaC
VSAGQPKPVRLVGAALGDRPACPLGVCDGSGWILGPEDVARPCECRESQLARRRARGVASAIPRKYRSVSFDAPPVSNLPAAAVGEIRRYVENLEENLEAGRGAWLFGDVGTGKTSLAMLVSKSALEAGHTVAIYSVPRLLAEIRRTYDSNPGETSYLDFVDRLVGVDLLHLDDLGTEKRSDWVLEQLYSIVNERYEATRAILVTSNLGEHELRDQIGERTVSRLIEICGQHMVPMSGRDLRDAAQI